MQKTVLIADDDESLTEILCARCESLGLAVDVANNAMTALGKIDEMMPDVVILDVEMPLGNGLSVCEMMATHRNLATIPVIMLTGRSDRETIRRCHDLCAFYVSKNGDVWSRIEPLLRELTATPGDAYR
jgi:DNA-binding response OmpR family regulator